MKREIMRAIGGIWSDLASIPFEKKIELVALFILFFILFGGFNTVYLLNIVRATHSLIYDAGAVVLLIVIDLFMLLPFAFAVLLYLLFALEPATSPMPTFFCYPANKNREPWEVNTMLYGAGQTVVVRREGIAATVLEGVLKNKWWIKKKSGKFSLVKHRKSRERDDDRVQSALLKAFVSRAPVVFLPIENRFVKQQPLVLFNLVYLLVMVILLFFTMSFIPNFGFYGFLLGLVFLLVYVAIHRDKLEFNHFTSFVIALIWIYYVLLGLIVFFTQSFIFPLRSVCFGMLMLSFGVHALLCFVVEDTRVFTKPAHEYIDERAKWLAFRRFLSNKQYVSKYLKMAEQEDLWKDWLMYGVALGVGPEIVEYLKKFIGPELKKQIKYVLEYLGKRKPF